MPSSHSPIILTVALDDTHAVANAGLILTATLAARLGVEQLVDLGDRPATEDLGDVSGGIGMLVAWRSKALAKVPRIGPPTAPDRWAGWRPAGSPLSSRAHPQCQAQARARRGCSQRSLTTRNTTVGTDLPQVWTGTSHTAEQRLYQRKASRSLLPRARSFLNAKTTDLMARPAPPPPGHGSLGTILAGVSSWADPVRR
jgi:hypothetical protein